MGRRRLLGRLEAHQIPLHHDPLRALVPHLHPSHRCRAQSRPTYNVAEEDGARVNPRSQGQGSAAPICFAVGPSGHQIFDN